MISYFLLVSLLQIVSSLVPPCETCKNFIPNKIKPDLGFCNMFKDINYNKGEETLIYNFAIHCRNNENMCGKNGYLYENSDNNSNEFNTKNKEVLVDKFDELNNRCCGEVNEKDELEQLERDFFELYQKMKRYNTKRVYKTTRELYKLFKNKN